MSLASRITSAFSWNTSKEESKSSFSSDALPGSHTMSPEIIGATEEGRPPYLHVRLLQNTSRDQRLTPIPGNDCRWYWRNDGRSSYAFPRYSQNSATRRSSYASEIHNPPPVLFHNLSPGRRSSWALWRLAPCSNGLLSWNNHIFWHLRVDQKASH